MKTEYVVAFGLLKEELRLAIEESRKGVAFWQECFVDIPYCDVSDLDMVEILDGYVIKGYINLWKNYVTLSYYEDIANFEANHLSAEDSDILRNLTGKFYFKERNQAVLEYPPREKLPDFVGTWADVFLEIVDYIRRKLCICPEMPPNLAEELLMTRDEGDN